MQEVIRQEKLIQKTHQAGFDFAEDRPLSSYTFGSYQRYCDRAKQKVIEYLKKTPQAKVPYWRVFCEAMAFPLVTRDDLLTWLDKLAPYIELHPAHGHKKLSPAREDDYITIIDRNRLQ